MSAIVNAFRGSGICPLNPQAIHPEKLGPAVPYTTSVPKPLSATSSRPTAKSGAASNTAKSELSLQGLEALIKPETLGLYSQRFDEGHDVEQDELYLIWSKMKALTITEEADHSAQAFSPPIPPQSSLEKNPVLPKSQQHISPVMDEVLTYPNPPCKAQRNTGTSSMPKHLSSEQVVQYLEDRQRKKIQEEEDKQKRKSERERKKREREMEKEKKRLERESRSRGQNG